MKAAALRRKGMERAEVDEILARTAMAVGKIEPSEYHLVRQKVMIFNPDTKEREEAWHIFTVRLDLRDGRTQ
jgi:hypothetical protein